ncbi:hypothetical protein A4X09_0g2518 [Tilletia walkeri]|uniref:DNA 3'-5' helicase n=1 Tax=Tilletia walkeri TaxID=117179 RepID=A0A8X7N9N6_9BASI|nr:hypothetical protein A4X09_0g2518 [Tilletia walkeri]
MSSSDDGSDFEIIGQALNTKKQPTAYGSRANKAPAASSSRSTLAQRSAEPSRTAARTERTVVVDEETGAQIREIDDELASIHEQIQALLVLEDELKEKRTTLLNLAKSSKSRAAPSAPVRPAPSASASRDYTRSDFDWSKLLKARLKEVWGYSKFRFCQEAVCNAALDGRDAVIIMPTGSGKSICYQLPALLSEGLTVVVSPLISLMLDQVLNLREVDVEAEHLSAAVPRQETAEILKGIREGTSTIKLLYVTPERVAKSKTLMSALQKA